MEDGREGGRGIGRGGKGWECFLVEDRREGRGRNKKLAEIELIYFLSMRH